jgi:hypothetical protein
VNETQTCDRWEFNTTLGETIVSEVRFRASEKCPDFFNDFFSLKYSGGWFATGSI